MPDTCRFLCAATPLHAATSVSHVVPQDPNIAASAMSPFRVRKDHYKGMTEAEKKAILDAQLAQMEEKKARRAQEQLENMMYARTQHDIQRALQEQVRGGGQAAGGGGERSTSNPGGVEGAGGGGAEKTDCDRVGVGRWAASCHVVG